VLDSLCACELSLSWKNGLLSVSSEYSRGVQFDGKVTSRGPDSHILYPHVVYGEITYFSSTYLFCVEFLCCRLLRLKILALSF